MWALSWVTCLVAVFSGGVPSWATHSLKVSDSDVGAVPILGVASSKVSLPWVDAVFVVCGLCSALATTPTTAMAMMPPVISFPLCMVKNLVFEWTGVLRPRSRAGVGFDCLTPPGGVRSRVRAMRLSSTDTAGGKSAGFPMGLAWKARAGE